MKPSVEYAAFPTRQSRTEFVANRFGAILTGQVLDVGCFEAPLRALLPAVDYTGIDVAGDPDIRLDIEKADRLPFNDNAFDCVLCIHVLEHLNNLYGMFDELVRVSRRHVLVGLPNCWRGARRPLARGQGEFRHYGLPVAEPVDRHKWFFNISQAMEFLQGKGAEKGLRIQELVITDNPKAAVTRLLRQIRYPGLRYHNRYSNTVWAVYQKTP
jgi:SAM-dependent methyltransferase